MKSEFSHWEVSFPMEVRDYELDSQGIVNNSVYLNYFEHARHKFLEEKGINFSDLQKSGIDLVVTRAEIDYVKSLKSGDRFTVDTSWSLKGRVRFHVLQRICRENDKCLIASSRFTVATLINGKPGYVEQIVQILTQSSM